MKGNEDMPPWNPIQPTCHPERKHKAKGLCDSCYDREYKRTPAARARNLKRVWKGSLKRLYNLTEDQYDALLTQQNNACALCRKPQPDKKVKRLSVDHDHDTGRIRGLLCTTCNFIIGKLDDADWRYRADTYLSTQTT